MLLQVEVACPQRERAPRLLPHLQTRGCGAERRVRKTEASPGPLHPSPPHRAPLSGAHYSCRTQVCPPDIPRGTWVARGNGRCQEPEAGLAPLAEQRPLPGDTGP